MMRAMALPTRARRASGHPKAMKMSRLTAVSSRKSTLSASRETEPAVSATANSTKKYEKFSVATMRTVRRSRRLSICLLVLFPVLPECAVCVHACESMDRAADPVSGRTSCASAVFRSVPRAGSYRRFPYRRSSLSARV
jgi:hypothetical protein